jgi:hypothetical protein
MAEIRTETNPNERKQLMQQADELLRQNGFDWHGRPKADVDRGQQRFEARTPRARFGTSK